MDEHRCGAGKLCRDPRIDVVTGAREPALIEEQRGLCRRCRAALRRACEELSGDYCRLSAASDAMAATGSEHVSGTPEPSTPLNMPAMALRSTLSEWAEAGLRMVADELRITVRPRQPRKGMPVHEYPPIDQAAKVLPENLDLLIDAPARPVRVWEPDPHFKEMDGIGVATKIMQNHWRVTSLLGETNPRRRLAMPCPVLDCGAQTLGIANGETDVTCSSCGGRWTEREYAWLAGLLIDEDKARKRADKRTTFLLDLAKWLVAERDWKLREVKRIASLTEEQLAGIDGWAVVSLLREKLDEAQGI